LTVHSSTLKEALPVAWGECGETKEGEDTENDTVPAGTQREGRGGEQGEGGNQINSLGKKHSHFRSQVAKAGGSKNSKTGCRSRTQ